MTLAGGMKASDVQAFAARGAAVAEGLNPGTVKIGETVYEATVGNPPMELQVDLGGDEVLGQLVVQVRKTLLPECPAARTAVEAHGRKWKVVSSYGHALAPVWTMRMEADQ